MQYKKKINERWPNGKVAFKRNKDVVKVELDLLISEARRIPSTLTYEDRSLSFLYPEPESKQEEQDVKISVLGDKIAPYVCKEKREAVRADLTKANAISVIRQSAESV